jgi:hypothetical protein
MNRNVSLVIAKAALGASLALGFLLTPHAVAHADPVDTIDLTDLPEYTATVDGVDYPICAVEDCSDQPGQVGLWLDKDTGNWYLELGETCPAQPTASDPCRIETYTVGEFDACAKAGVL